MNVDLVTNGTVTFSRCRYDKCGKPIEGSVAKPNSTSTYSLNPICSALMIEYAGLDEYDQYWFSSLETGSIIPDGSHTLRYGYDLAAFLFTKSAISDT